MSTELKITGMTCQHCVATVTRALAAVTGVERVRRVDLDSGLAEVEGQPDAQALLAAVQEAGYQAQLA